ncbi:MAG: hypothetical protein IJS00_02145 [Paludibacteraceae bacterium]|nr:hypothetical protein [Paludibacteraceae bacterium]
MGQTSRKYVGKATAPVIPAIHFTYNWDRWNLQAGFNIIGGGGKCKFNDGLGMFEAALAGNALQLKQATGQNVAYTLSQSITGESYQYGIYLGTSFEVWKEHLAISVGLQGNYTNNRYNGGLRDMQLWMGDDYSIPAYNYLIGAAAQKEAAGDVTTAAQLNAAAAKVQNMPDVELDCRQTGFGVTPVLGIDLRVNEIFNVSFRYQFQTVMKLKNKSSNSASADAMTQLANFLDGKKLRSDVPGYFSVGMQVAPIEKLRINASYRYFDEKHAKRDMVNDAANEKNEGTHEPCVGIEYDIFKYLTFSAGYQAGIYKQTNDERSELDFQVNSHSILVGFRINAGSHVNIDLGYMHSFYDKKDKTQDMGNGLEYKTNFWRKNDVFGVGVGLAF